MQRASSRRVSQRNANGRELRGATNHDYGGAVSMRPDSSSSQCDQDKRVPASGWVGNGVQLFTTLTILLLLVVGSVWSGYAVAAQKFARTGGTWGTDANWSSVSCTVAGLPTTFPTSSD